MAYPEAPGLIAKVRQLDQQIANAQAVIASVPARRQATHRWYVQARHE